MCSAEVTKNVTLCRVSSFQRRPEDWYVAVHGSQYVALHVGPVFALILVAAWLFHLKE